MTVRPKPIASILESTKISMATEVAFCISSISVYRGVSSAPSNVRHIRRCDADSVASERHQATWCSLSSRPQVWPPRLPFGSMQMHELNSWFPAAVNGCGQDRSIGCLANMNGRRALGRQGIVRQVQVDVERRHALQHRVCPGPW